MKTSTSTTKSRHKRRTIEDYEFVDHPEKNTSDLGKGTYGRVKLVKDKRNDQLFAMKIVFSLSSQFQGISLLPLLDK